MLDQVQAVVRYGPIARDIAMKLKYAGRTGFAETIARLMARLVDDGGAWLIAPVPLHRWRMWRRGYNQSALIARALAQDTPLLLADEPVAGLDPAAQLRTMKVFADLANEGRSVIASIHDLGLAALHCTRLVMVERGRTWRMVPPVTC